MFPPQNYEFQLIPDLILCSNFDSMGFPSEENNEIHLWIISNLFRRLYSMINSDLQDSEIFHIPVLNQLASFINLGKSWDFVCLVIWLVRCIPWSYLLSKHFWHRLNRFCSICNDITNEILCRIKAENRFILNFKDNRILNRNNNFDKLLNHTVKVNEFWMDRKTAWTDEVSSFPKYSKPTYT